MNQAHEFHAEQVDQPDATGVVYRMQGVLSDTKSCFEFLNAFKAGVDEAPDRILFNLSRIEHIYSAGVGIVAGCYTAARDAGKQLMLVKVPNRISRVLTISGLQPLIPSYANEEEALAAPLP